MSEETKTELKLPKAYVRPSLAEFTSPGHGYKAEDYESFFGKLEAELAAQYASGAVTDENFVDIRDPDFEDDMTDADGDGLPDILHVKSQVRAQDNRSQRAQHPTRHRFKQYLFADPSKRLVRKRPLRVAASDVRANLDELIEKERIGILSVHAPNGARIDLAALKAGRVVMSAVPLAPPLPNPPLDSAANDTPAGENMQQYLGGTFINDPAADDVIEEMTAEKEAEAAKKDPAGTKEATTEGTGDFVDPASSVEPAVLSASTESSSTPAEENEQGLALANTELVEPAKEESAKTESSSSAKGGSKSSKKGSSR